MSHTVALIFTIITIAILGLMAINLLWISGKYIDTFGMAYVAKRDIYRKFKSIITERTPENVKEMLFLYGLSEFQYPSGTAFSISMPNKIDLQPMKGVLVKVESIVDLITCKPLWVLYSNSDFETLKIDMNNPNSLFACAYIADFSIVYKRYLTLGESKFMHDYMMEKENKEA